MSSTTGGQVIGSLVFVPEFMTRELLQCSACYCYCMCSFYLTTSVSVGSQVKPKDSACVHVLELASTVHQVEHVKKMVHRFVRPLSMPC